MRRKKTAGTKNGPAFGRAAKIFLRIRGTQKAAAFSYSAFFSFFPLIIIFITAASFFIDHNAAANAIVNFAREYVPLGEEMRGYVFSTVRGVVRMRVQVGSVMFFMLVWVSVQFFSTLILAANEAWNLKHEDWWRSPMKSLALFLFVSVGVLSAVFLSALAKMAELWLAPHFSFVPWFYSTGVFLVPWAAVFSGLAFFYKLAPARKVKFSDVWLAALFVTVLLWAGESLFVAYLEFSSLNAVYGAFSGVMALLLWIYVSGCAIIYGACLCAARVLPVRMPAADRI